MQIGQRIKELREKKGLSLTEVSKRSGVQLATLSRIENLRMTGTLESHLNIAKALEVELTDLYSNIAVEEKGRGQPASLPPQREVFVHSEKSSFEILTNKILSKKMMPILLKLEPGGTSASEQNPAGTEQFIFVLEGEIEAVIGKEAYKLSKHHTLYFDASLQHQIVNKGKTTAKVLSVTTPVVL